MRWLLSLSLPIKYNFIALAIPCIHCCYQCIDDPLPLKENKIETHCSTSLKVNQGGEILPNIIEIFKLIDLSLIKVFIIVYETKNISHAAEPLNLSQPYCDL